MENSTASEFSMLSQNDEHASVKSMSSLWGVTPSGDSFDPKTVQFPDLPKSKFLKAGSKNFGQSVIYVFTNTIREEADHVFQVVRCCQSNDIFVTHALVDELYVFLADAVNNSLRAVDVLVDLIMPFADSWRTLKGSLSSPQREKLRNWAHDAGETMIQSQAKFTLTQPAGSQIGHLAHAALGFQFMLDIASLSDRHIPERLNLLPASKLCKFEGRVFDSFAFNSAALKHQKASVGALLSWMEPEDMKTYTRRIAAGKIMKLRNRDGGEKRRRQLIKMSRTETDAHHLFSAEVKNLLWMERKRSEEGKNIQNGQRCSPGFALSEMFVNSTDAMLSGGSFFLDSSSLVSAASSENDYSTTESGATLRHVTVDSAFKYFSK